MYCVRIIELPDNFNPKCMTPRADGVESWIDYDSYGEAKEEFSKCFKNLWMWKQL